MIAVIDYDMGNLRSVSKALEHLGEKVCVTRDPQKIKSSAKIILPGVGAFPVCMDNLEKYGLAGPIRSHIESGKWFLGICLGLQLLFEESCEFGPVKGLGILRGRVVKFALNGGQGGLKIPHMGWNRVYKAASQRSVPLLNGIDDGAYFYFVHSYYVEPADSSIVVTQTDYGVRFCSSIRKDNVLACQFHPEKSQSAGLKVLENFVKLKT